MCCLGTPRLVLRDDERLWATPKIEKRFQRWAILVGAAVLINPALSWADAEKVFRYLEKGISVFLKELPGFVDSAAAKKGGSLGKGGGDFVDREYLFVSGSAVMDNGQREGATAVGELQVVDGGEFGDVDARGFEFATDAGHFLEAVRHEAGGTEFAR